MLRKGIALVVILLFVGLSIVSSTGETAEEIPLKEDAFSVRGFLDINGTMGENGWYISPIHISFQYNPNIERIWYSITEDLEPVWKLYEGLFIFGEEGKWFFQYKWEDIWGNVTQGELIIIMIDYTPPDRTDCYRRNEQHAEYPKQFPPKLF